MNYSVRSVDLNSLMERVRAPGNCGFARGKFIAVESCLKFRSFLIETIKIELLIDRGMFMQQVSFILYILIDLEAFRDAEKLTRK